MSLSRVALLNSATVWENQSLLSSAHPSNDTGHAETCTPRDECYVLLLSGCAYCMGVDGAIDTNFCAHVFEIQVHRRDSNPVDVCLMRNPLRKLKKTSFSSTVSSTKRRAYKNGQRILTRLTHTNFGKLSRATSIIDRTYKVPSTLLSHDDSVTTSFELRLSARSRFRVNGTARLQRKR